MAAKHQVQPISIALNRASIRPLPRENSRSTKTREDVTPPGKPKSQTSARSLDRHGPVPSPRADYPEVVQLPVPIDHADIGLILVHLRICADIGAWFGKQRGADCNRSLPRTRAIDPSQHQGTVLADSENVSLQQRHLLDSSDRGRGWEHPSLPDPHRALPGAAIQPGHSECPRAIDGKHISLYKPK